MRQPRALTETLPRRAFRVGREAAVDQQHEAQHALAGIARGESGRKSEIGAGGIAADREPRRIDAEAGSFARGETDHRHHFVKSYREPVLGRQTIVDRERSNPALAYQLAQHRIPARQAALHEAAAVRVDNERRVLRAVGQV